VKQLLSGHEKNPIIEEDAETVRDRLACVGRGPTAFVLFTYFGTQRLFAVQAWSVRDFEEVPVEEATAKTQRKSDRACRTAQATARKRFLASSRS